MYSSYRYFALNQLTTNQIGHRRRACRAIHWRNMVARAPRPQKPEFLVAGFDNQHHSDADQQFCLELYQDLVAMGLVGPRRRNCQGWAPRLKSAVRPPAR